MKEINKNNLHRAVEKLPVYEPPEMIWEHISQRLDQEIKERSLQEAIGRLRTFEPPESVWGEIEAGLSKNESTPVNVRRLYFRLTAAAILLLIATVNFWPDRQPSPQIAYRIDEENIQPLSVTVDWDADEALISEVLTMFNQSPKATSSSNYQILLEELTELNEAKQELEVIMQKYGQDPTTIEQLKEIELERTSVIKVMASLI